MSYKKILATIAGVIVLGSIVAAIAFPTGNTRGSTWEQATTFFFDTKPNTATYNVEAAGWNVRVIEWTPDGNSNYRCMFVAGTGKAGSACYPLGVLNNAK